MGSAIPVSWCASIPVPEYRDAPQIPRSFIPAGAHGNAVAHGKKAKTSAYVSFVAELQQAPTPVPVHIFTVRHDVHAIPSYT